MSRVISVFKFKEGASRERAFAEYEKLSKLDRKLYKKEIKLRKKRRLIQEQVFALQVEMRDCIVKH